MHLYLTLVLLSWLPVSLSKVTTVEEVAVLGGRSITIPCHYEPQYAGYVKYWCQGRMREICTSLARTDIPRSSITVEQKVAIFDDPVQLVFSVTMTDVKEEDSGWYWCGVEVGGMWSADVAASVHVTVIQGMSVVNSRLSGEEGTSISVECQYSDKYRNSEKKWCRSGDWSSCVVTDAEGTSEDKSVVINDDRKGAFSVTIKSLQKRDAGWYWCAAAQQQMAVHVMVTPRATTTAVYVTSPTRQPQSTSQYTYVPQPKSVAKDWHYQRHFMESPLMVCAAIVILMAIVMLSFKMWHQYRKTQRERRAMQIKARLSELPGDGGDWQNSSVVFLNSGS